MKSKIAIGVLIVISCLIYWFHDEVRYQKAVSPPPGATNLISFLKMRPGVISIRAFTNASDAYLEIVGPVPKFGLALRSGPPAYIFNKAGDLIDWAVDSGEASEFNRKWSSLSNSAVISTEDAKKLVGYQ